MFEIALASINWIYILTANFVSVWALYNSLSNGVIKLKQESRPQYRCRMFTLWIRKLTWRDHNGCDLWHTCRGKNSLEKHRMLFGKLILFSYIVPSVTTFQMQSWRQRELLVGYGFIILPLNRLLCHIT